MKKFYLTTPIYYPSDNLHIGHTYTTVAADALKKFKEMQGYDVYFVTGADEHGQKIAEMAKKNGLTPKKYVDKIVASIKELWKTLDIDYDKFVRTTDDYHKEAVKKIFKELYDKGEIYKSIYKGHYCTPCESFWAESQLESGNCPDCGRPVHLAEEEAYFFKLSKYRDRLLKLYEDNPGFIQPESRKNEMINNFLKDGLDDLSVSRSSFDWGIEVDFDPDHVVYVWIDALSCYLTGLGYGGEDSKMEKFWPADVHLVGKEIVRFHAIIWPAILMALDLPLPKQVFGHGWILFEDDKMSKSKGNVIYPEPIIELYGVDAFKYFLLREFSFGQDGSFSREKFLQRLNSDLANDLGNLVNRTITMIQKYNDGVIPKKAGECEFAPSLIELGLGVGDKFEAHMDKLSYSNAIEEIWKLIRRTNKYIDETRPWVLAKEDKKDLLDTVLFNLAESIRIIAILIYPFMEKTSREINRQMGLDGEVKWDDAKEWGKIPEGTKVGEAEAIFPRLEIEKELEKLNKANDDLIAKRTKGRIEEVGEKVEKVEEITIDEFAKLKLKTGEIISCEDHPDADKLYVLKLKLDQEERQVVSGIKDFYKPEDLIGKKVVVITNLKPVKLRGVESQGMVLAAEDKDGKLSLVSTLEDIKSGASIS